MEIDEKTSMADLMGRTQALSKVFKKYGLDCLTCRGLAEETVAQLAVRNGLDVKAFTEEIRRVLG
ncbi:MAG: hypothetical protein JXA20_07950 [Spirochaetes bacterium]|nr:hypothetical protein [Spirochaetota bacterium]